MMIHEDQQNVRALCELADFIDSGYQSFHEQTRERPPKREAEAAFFAGTALALKLLEHFRAQDYTAAECDFLMGLLAREVNDYMASHGMQLEWEPHVPSAWKQ